MTYSFEVNTRSQSLGIIGLSEDRTQRLELMLLLQEKYQGRCVKLNFDTPPLSVLFCADVPQSINRYVVTTLATTIDISNQ